MNTARVNLGELVAAAGGGALLVLMFLPWFGGRLSGRGELVRAPRQTGWESFGTFFEVLILAAIVVAVGVAVARAMDALPLLPVDQPTLVTAAGVVAFLVIGFRLIDPPDLIDVAIPGLEVDISRKAAAFLGLAASALIALGGYLQRRGSVRRVGFEPTLTGT